MENLFSPTIYNKPEKMNHLKTLQQMTDKKQKTKAEEKFFIDQILFSARTNAQTTTYTLTPEFERWDCETDKYLFELKIREFTYQEFTSKYKKSPIIEVEKWNALIEQHEKTGKQPILVFAYTHEIFNKDGLKLEERKPCGFTMYNLLKYSGELKTIKIPCPEHTKFKSTKMVMKDCLILQDKFFPTSAKKYVDITNDDTMNKIFSPDSDDSLLNAYLNVIDNNEEDELDAVIERWNQINNREQTD